MSLSGYINLIYVLFSKRTKVLQSLRLSDKRTAAFLHWTFKYRPLEFGSNKCCVKEKIFQLKFNKSNHFQFMYLCTLDSFVAPVECTIILFFFEEIISKKIYSVLSAECLKVVPKHQSGSFRVPCGAKKFLGRVEKS